MKTFKAHKMKNYMLIVLYNAWLKFIIINTIQCDINPYAHTHIHQCNHTPTKYHLPSMKWTTFMSSGGKKFLSDISEKFTEEFLIYFELDLIFCIFEIYEHEWNVYTILNDWRFSSWFRAMHQLYCIHLFSPRFICILSIFKFYSLSFCSFIAPNNLNKMLVDRTSLHLRQFISIRTLNLYTRHTIQFWK